MRHYSPLANVFDSFTRMAVHGVHIGHEKEKGQTLGLTCCFDGGPSGIRTQNPGIMSPLR